MTHLTEKDWEQLFNEYEQSLDFLYPSNEQKKIEIPAIEKELATFKTAQIHQAYLVANSTIYEWNNKKPAPGTKNYQAKLKAYYHSSNPYHGISNIKPNIRDLGSKLARHYRSTTNISDIKSLEPILVVGRKGGYFGTSPVFCEEVSWEFLWGNPWFEYREVINATSRKKAYKKFYEKRTESGTDIETLEITRVTQLKNIEEESINTL